MSLLVQRNWNLANSGIWVRLYRDWRCKPNISVKTDGVQQTDGRTDGEKDRRNLCCTFPACNVAYNATWKNHQTFCISDRHAYTVKGLLSILWLILKQSNSCNLQSQNSQCFTPNHTDTKQLPGLLRGPKGRLESPNGRQQGNPWGGGSQPLPTS